MADSRATNSRATNSAKPKSNVSVDIKGHHAQCELNFYRFLTLMPGWNDGTQQWAFAIGEGNVFQVQMRIIDVARYTTTVEVQQQQMGLQPPRLVVRLYHDASMAEIVSWDGHRHWKPQYDYPNPQMYMPDEKLALNRFLGDWLEICRTKGYAHAEKCETVLVKRK